MSSSSSGSDNPPAADDAVAAAATATDVAGAPNTRSSRPQRKRGVAAAPARIPRTEDGANASAVRRAAAAAAAADIVEEADKANRKARIWREVELAVKKRQKVQADEEAEWRREAEAEFAEQARQARAEQERQAREENRRQEECRQEERRQAQRDEARLRAWKAADDEEKAGDSLLRRALQAQGGGPGPNAGSATPASDLSPEPGPFGKRTTSTASSIASSRTSTPREQEADEAADAGDRAWKQELERMVFGVASSVKSLAEREEHREMEIATRAPGKCNWNMTGHVLDVQRLTQTILEAVRGWCFALWFCSCFVRPYSRFFFSSRIFFFPSEWTRCLPTSRLT